jgi:predicted kinase
MTKVYVMIGLPYSGKSTWARQQASKWKEADVLSTDVYIESWAATSDQTYNDVFCNKIKKATKYFKEDIDDYVSGEYAPVEAIFIDQTNLSAAKRKSLVEKFSDSRFEKIAVVFNVSDETIKERRDQRIGKVISDDLIESMKARFEKPTFEEGWDAIMEIDAA